MFHALKLQEDNQAEKAVQLLKAGTFNYDGEELNISRDLLKKLKKNFDEGVRGYQDRKLPIDYFHENDKVAAGWIENLYLEKDDTELWAEVKWTEKASKIIGSGELRYLSVEFSYDYVDNETGTSHGATLFGAGLTNRPFIKGMKPVVKFQENEREKLRKNLEARSKKYNIEITEDAALTPPQGQPQNESDYADPVNFKFPLGDKAQTQNARVRFKQFANSIYKSAASKVIVHARIVNKELELGITPSFDPSDPLDAALPEDLKNKIKPKKEGDKKMGEMTPEQMMAKIAELEKEIAALKGANDKTVEEMACAKKELEEAKATIAAAEKTKTFDKLMSEGKTVEAQREAFMSGDMVKFSELSKAVNLQEKGSNSDKNQKFDSAQDEVLSLARTKAKEKNISVAKAISLVLSESKELNERYMKETSVA